MDKRTQKLPKIIYLQVGDWKETKDGPILKIDDAKDKLISKLPDRKLVRIMRKDGRYSFDRKVCAVYEKKEFCAIDQERINNHNREEGTLVDTGEEIIYFDFTRNRLMETVRQRKINLLTKKGLLDKDDGTIFGEVKITKIIPEHTIVVPEYEEEIYVRWDCWNDGWTTDGKDYYRCRCGDIHYQR